MSGGHFNYDNDHIGYVMDGQWHDEELNALFYDLFVANWSMYRSGGLSGALDFWLSGDIGEDGYREAVKAFKDKWLGRTPEDRADFYADLLQRRCDELKAELRGETMEDG